MSATFLPDSRAAAIWRNGLIPVVYDRGKHQTLLVRCPFRPDNRSYLRGKGHRIHYMAEYKAWEIARSRFNDVVRLLLARWGAVYIIQTYRELEKCAPACWDARGFDCVCSCLGANHGSGVALAHVVSDTFAFEWGPKRLACRLLRAGESTPRYAGVKPECGET